ncbi:hypothetical protein D3C77_390450 [compost metagenome]
MALLHRAGAPFPLHVREVQVAGRIGQRRAVQVDVAGGWRALELTLAHGDQHFCHGDRAQAVRRLSRLFRLIRTALSADDVQFLCCAHVFLQA